MYHNTQETQNDGECSHYVKHGAKEESPILTKINLSVTNT